MATETPQLNPQFILYTYALAGGVPTCHFYEYADEQDAKNAGAKLAAQFSADPNHSYSQFTYMVGPLEPHPA